MIKKDRKRKYTKSTYKGKKNIEYVFSLHNKKMHNRPTSNMSKINEASNAAFQTGEQISSLASDKQEESEDDSLPVQDFMDYVDAAVGKKGVQKKKEYKGGRTERKEPYEVIQKENNNPTKKIKNKFSDKELENIEKYLGQTKSITDSEIKKGKEIPKNEDNFTYKKEKTQKKRKKRYGKQEKENENDIEYVNVISSDTELNDIEVYLGLEKPKTNSFEFVDHKKTNKKRKNTEKNKENESSEEKFFLKRESKQKNKRKKNNISNEEAKKYNILGIRKKEKSKKKGNSISKIFSFIMSPIDMISSLVKKFSLIVAAIFALLILLIVLVVVIIFCFMTAINNEEENNSSYDVTVSVSSEVEAYREDVLAEAKKHGMEAYINLYLAVMEQESHGIGSDVFQASESKGLPVGTLSIKESIKQGVAYLSANLKRAGVKSPADLAGIRLGLQGYNFGGAYVDYAKKKDGKWTQENVLAYAKEKSNGVKNSGTKAKILGPWKYGDQYYTKHVLRYYDIELGNSSSGDAVKVPLNKRMDWLFPNGIPKTEKEMQKYLIKIQVPILNKKGKADTMALTVHKKLATEVKEIFKEMKEAGFQVLPESTAAYSWRTMASNSSKLSYHSYGCTVDINWNHNGASYTEWDYKPGEDIYSVTDKIVSIWKKHGFYWGGDWNQKLFDPMHFSYVNH